MGIDNIIIISIIIIYFIVMLSLGIFYVRRSNKSSDQYFIGGRSLGPWLTSLSAEASDMSGWLLMGLPGLAYFTGCANAGWLAIGLVWGTYANWKLVARRLRNYSEIAGNSITLPDFFSNRFHDKKKILMTITAIIIFVFFVIYVASCLVTCGKLLNSLFGWDYLTMMLVIAVIVFFYTFTGGYLSVCTTDLIQSILMCVSLIVVFVGTVCAVGGVENVVTALKDIPGFLSMTSSAVSDGNGGFSEPIDYGILGIISSLSWGLGYFGIPHILVRFVSIRDASELKRSRVIAVAWLIISLSCALCIGLLGRAFIPNEFMTQSSAEAVIVVISKMILPSVFCGIVITGILAASMSSSSSYLIIAGSSIARNFYKELLKKNASDKQVMLVSRVTLLIVMIFAIFISQDPESSIFNIVSYAWAGFGASFGPLVILSLYWKRTTLTGAVAGILSGAISVLLYENLLSPLGGIFELYSLLPCFILSFLVIIVVSLCSKKPDASILKDFEKMLKK